MSIKAAKVVWSERYSDSMEDDDQGRWARVAYAGKGNILNSGARFEIAWVKKLVFTDENKINVVGFTISFNFPAPKSKIFHKTLQEAKDDVEEQFEYFIKNCCQ